MPGVGKVVFHTLSHLNITMTMRSRFFFFNPNCTKEVMEAQKDNTTINLKIQTGLLEPESYTLYSTFSKVLVPFEKAL